MPSIDSKSLDGEETLEPPSSLQHLHPLSYNSMPVYPYTHVLPANQQPIRTKRRQVKNACTHCQKACKKCDDARPCLRCVKYGYSDECVDSQRKERKKGVKRGPYKKRDGKDRAACSVTTSDSAQQGATVVNGVPPQAAANLSGAYLPIGYPPGFYPPYPPMVTKSPNGAPIYPPPQYYLAPGPQLQPQPQLHPHSTQDVDPNQYPHSQPQPFYQPALFSPVHYQYPMHRQDPSASSSTMTQYPPYSPSNYTKNSATINTQAEPSHGATNERNEDHTLTGSSD
ncbi:hypothetical protein CVT24_005725 [Panaeolus cyanescens]|uniref:Zn(2)-C6 fungal-type domain-containing protein n=1 Tax=Panaeolus cyanescens TaxID=181874 RepID=A0A409VDM6_9AGAR|nr:hypothetical protein CVT24_005725 [Panaeolus cyanescens]